MQPALLEPIRAHAAVQRWQAKPFTPVNVPLEAARRIRPVALAAAQAPTPVHVLVGIRGKLADLGDPDLLPRKSADGRQWGPAPSGDLFVQATSDDRLALVRALRDIGDAAGGSVRLLDEVTGTRLGDGVEPFGYRDGVAVPTAAEIEAAAAIDEPGPGLGGSWILYVGCRQDLARFATLPAAAQDATIGRDRAGTLLAGAPADSHVQRMRSVSPVTFPYIRRGFPYRSLGQEGLAFVAAGKSPALFAAALDAMVGFSGPADRLNAFVTFQDAGVFWAPPDGWAGWSAP